MNLGIETASQNLTLPIQDHDSFDLKSPDLQSLLTDKSLEGSFLIPTRMNASISMSSLLSPNSDEKNDGFSFGAYSMVGLNHDIHNHDNHENHIPGANVFISPVSPPNFLFKMDMNAIDINAMDMNAMQIPAFDTADYNELKFFRQGSEYPCTFPGCSKTFDKLYNLRSHLRIHYLPKSHSCSQCDRSFRRSHDLRRHERSHQSIKLFKCGKCMKGFTRSDALKRHHAKLTSPCFMYHM